MIRKTLLTLTLAAGLALAGSANAASILYDFAGASAAASVNDFGNGVTVSDINIINGGSGGIQIGNTDQSDPNNASMKFGGTENAKLSFTITIPAGTTVNLTQLDFNEGFDSTKNGSGADAFWKWDLALTAGSASPNTGADSQSSGRIITTNFPSVALSGLTGLTDTSVTFTLSMDNGTSTSYTSGNANDRRQFFDDITLTGEVVTNIPEPASLATGLLGLTLIAARRRR